MSEKLNRLSKKANKIFTYNLEKELQEKYPDVKKDEDKVKIIGVSTSSYYAYKKKGFPDYFPKEAAEKLGCTEEKLLKYDDAADIATISEAMYDVCLTTIGRRLCTLLVGFITIFAIIANQSFETALAVYNTGFILGTCSLLIGIFGFSGQKNNWRRCSLTMAAIFLTGSGVGFGMMSIDYYIEFFSNLIS